MFIFVWMTPPEERYQLLVFICTSHWVSRVIFLFNQLSLCLKWCEIFEGGGVEFHGCCLFIHHVHCNNYCNVDYYQIISSVLIEEKLEFIIFIQWIPISTFSHWPCVKKKNMKMTNQNNYCENVQPPPHFQIVPRSKHTCKWGLQWRSHDVFVCATFVQMLQEIK